MREMAKLRKAARRGRVLLVLLNVALAVLVKKMLHVLQMVTLQPSARDLGTAVDGHGAIGALLKKIVRRPRRMPLPTWT